MSAIDLQHLQILENQRQAAESQKVGVTFMKDIKNSVLFQYDWAEILSAAPISMSLIGACYIAASASAVTISFEDARGRDGFQYLRYPTLKASLVQVSDTGRMAFIEAEKNMAKISLASSHLAQTVNKILHCVNNLPDEGAALALETNLNSLKRGSNHCYEYAKATEKAFVDWLLLVNELHQVSVYKQELTEKQKEENIRMMEARKVSLELTETDVDSGKAAATQFKSIMNSAKAAFTRESKRYYGPWDILALSMAGALAQTTTTAISQTIPSMMDNSVTVPTQDSNAWGREGDGRQINGLTVLPQDFDDPAFAWATTISTLTAHLHSLLTSGKDGGVNWDSARTVLDVNGITCLTAQFQHYRDSIQFTHRNPSLILKTAICDALEILEEVQKFVDKHSLLSFGGLVAGSPEVERWQNEVNTIQSSVLKLKTTAATMPGNSPGPPPGFPMAPIVTSQFLDPIAQSAAFAQATERLKVTEAAYTNAQSNYAKATKHATQVRAKLSKVRAELKKLSLTNATLEDVKQILVQCIGVLIQLKTQISKLVQFFGAISALVEHVIATSVHDFMMDAQNIETSMVKLGGISLGDFQRQAIFSSSLIVRAYFAVVQSIADMYTKVSREYIFKGLEICGELSKATLANEPRKVIAERNTQLENYTNSVETALHTMITEAQYKTILGLNQRVQSIAQTTTRLNPSFPGASEAIELGAAENNQDMKAKVVHHEPSLYELADTSFDYGGDEI